MRVSGTIGRSIAVALLAASGVVAAFATMAPGVEQSAPPVTALIVEPVVLRLHEVPSAGAYVQEEQFQRGDTLAGFLGRLGLDESVIPRLARTPALRALRPGSHVRADVAT